ncbi:unnamed protein product [Euphydryas editha]|nr:unnamed protein product [Euphydryas editha]
MIYLIPLEDETCYIKPPTTDEYCLAEYPLSYTNYLYRIIEEIKKNEKIIETIKMEENYITTLALSNRKDIMDDVIHYKIIVFDNYGDILKEEIPLSIPNNIAEYFDIDSFYFLIKITVSCHLQQKFSDVLSNLFGNLKIHITLLSQQKVLKTSSIKVQGQLKDLNIVVPLNAQMLNFTNITVNINLVTLIPGALNEKEVLWSNLHYRTIVLNSEHFIKSERSQNNVQHLKEPKKSINELIFETACNHHGQLFKINEAPNMNTIKWSFYVKLPTHYEESLSNRDYYFENFNISKATYLFNEISSKDFLKSKSILCFSIGSDNVEIELLNDGFSDPMVKVTSHNPQIALNVRSFISNLAYNMFKNCKNEFVSNDIYQSIKELENSFELCTLGTVSSEEFCRIFHQYQKCIMGAIVL